MIDDVKIINSNRRVVIHPIPCYHNLTVNHNEKGEGNACSMQIVTHQARILMILDGLGIEVEVVDITAPGMKEATDFMRSNGKKKDEERHVLPPQIFNGDKYCGVIICHAFIHSV